MVKAVDVKFLELSPLSQPAFEPESASVPALVWPPPPTGVLAETAAPAPVLPKSKVQSATFYLDDVFMSGTQGTNGMINFNDKAGLMHFFFMSTGLATKDGKIDKKRFGIDYNLNPGRPKDPDHLPSQEEARAAREEAFVYLVSRVYRSDDKKDNHAVLDLDAAKALIDSKPALKDLLRVYVVSDKPMKVFLPAKI